MRSLMAANLRSRRCRRVQRFRRAEHRAHRPRHLTPPPAACDTALEWPPNTAIWRSLA